MAKPSKDTKATSPVDGPPSGALPPNDTDQTSGLPAALTDSSDSDLKVVGVVVPDASAPLHAPGKGPLLIDELDALAAADPTSLEDRRPKTVSETTTTEAESLENQKPAQTGDEAPGKSEGDTVPRYYGNELAEKLGLHGEGDARSDQEKQHAAALGMIGELEHAAVHSHGLEGDRDLHARAAQALRTEAGVPFDYAIDRLGRPLP